MIECKQVLKVVCDKCGKEEVFETVFEFGAEKPDPLSILIENKWKWLMDENKFICPDHRIELIPSYWRVDGFRYTSKF